MDHGDRRGRLAARLDDLKVDALLITRLVNVRYLTGFTGSNGQLLLSSDPVLFTDFRYEEQSQKEAPDVRRRIYAQAFRDELRAALREAGTGRLGFERSGVTYESYESLRELDAVEMVPMGPEVERLRWEKDPEEIGHLERAQEITDAAFDEIVGKLAEGMTEREVAFELELAMRRGGAERVGFDTIAAFGENAAEPHHSPTDRRLARGDLVKLDFGCVVEGYHSDMTRTVAFGDPGEELRGVYETVARAQRAGEEAVRAGVTGREADEAARRVIEEAGHGDRFGHSLGHGVGLEVHEGPTLRKKSDDVLPESAVVTVEPGIYLPGLGGVRIEDAVVVGPDGCRPLPTTTKELIVL
ncbi:MAG TPA: aminopeptidase P family protein [Actinomycetota bacterium]|nr:aminopeptidase P family protein [Actinomycetota bacterium]